MKKEFLKDVLDNYFNEEYVITVEKIEGIIYGCSLVFGKVVSTVEKKDNYVVVTFIVQHNDLIVVSPETNEILEEGVDMSTKIMELTLGLDGKVQFVSSGTGVFNVANKAKSLFMLSLVGKSVCLENLSY